MNDWSDRAYFIPAGTLTAEDKVRLTEVTGGCVIDLGQFDRGIFHLVEEPEPEAGDA